MTEEDNRQMKIIKELTENSQRAISWGDHYLEKLEDEFLKQQIREIKERFEQIIKYCNEHYQL